MELNNYNTLSKHLDKIHRLNMLDKNIRIYYNVNRIEIKQCLDILKYNNYNDSFITKWTELVNILNKEYYD